MVSVFVKGGIMCFISNKLRIKLAVMAPVNAIKGKRTIKNTHCEVGVPVMITVAK